MKIKIDDFPLWHEIKSEYIELRRSGKGRAEAVDILSQQYRQEITVRREDDGLLFGTALADGQLTLKELTDDTAQQALLALNTLEQWPSMDPRCIEKRRIGYAEAPMPECKSVRKSRKFRCKWRVGDTFAFPLSGNLAEELGLAGHYAMLRKVDEVEFGDGRLFPVVVLSTWMEETLPHTMEEYHQAPTMRLHNGRLGTPKDTYEYRTEIIFKSDRQLKQMEFIYLGNFCEVPMPGDEIIIRNPGNMAMVIPENFCKDFCVYWKLDKYYTST